MLQNKKNEEYHEIAKSLLKQYRHIKPEGKKFLKGKYITSSPNQNKSNYLVEAEKFLQSYNQKKTRRYKAPKKTTFENGQFAKYKEISKTEEVVKDKKADVDVDEILIENIDTKEGLKAIVTELLKRRIENIKNQS